MRRNFTRLVAVDHDNRRVMPPRVGVTQFNPAASNHRRLMLTYSIFQNSCKEVRGEFISCCLVSLLNGFVEIAYTGPMQGGYVVNIGKINETYATLQFVFHILLM